MRLLTGIFFIGGLILAGSEGPFFPLANLAGVGVFAMSSVLVNTGERGSRW